jgi:hypothetical protein
VQASILAHGEDLVSRLPRPWRCSNIRGGVSVSESRYDVYCSRVDSFSSNPQERFTGYLNSVRILRLDSNDLEPYDNFTAKEIASRRRAQMPNLKEVRPVGSCDNCSTIEKTIRFDGQQVVVEHFVWPFQLESLIETNISIRPSDAQTQGILTGVKIRPHSFHEVEEAQLGSVIALLNRRPSLGVSMSQTHPFANLRTLELLPRPGWPYPVAKFAQLDKLDTLDQILSVCPRLDRLACRLKDSPVTAKTLNRVLCKGKNLVSVHIETNGFLTPYLSALSRFEQVTLACTTLLTETDLDLLYGHVKPDQPFIPRLRHFTYGVTIGLRDTVLAKDTPCNRPYSVARLIRKLLPRDCVFATSTAHYHSAYGMKEPMTQWWNDFTGIMDIMMKEIDPPLPAILPVPREP